MRRKSYNRPARKGRTFVLLCSLLLVLCAGLFLLTPPGHMLLDFFAPAQSASYPASIVLPNPQSTDPVPAFPVFQIPRVPLELGAPDCAIGAQNVCLVDLKTGDVLWEKNAQELLYPASTTKIMTALLMVEKLPDLSKKITADAGIIQSFAGTSASNADILPGEELTLSDLLHCILLPSGNEASSMAAQYIAGSEERFAQLMTERAHELGALHTTFVNAHGLHDPNHQTTAADLALLAKAFLGHSVLKEISSLYRYTLEAGNLRGPREIYSTLLMQNPNSAYFDPTVHGIKTGTTTQAGRCFISTATRGGRTLLLVVMNAPYKDGDGKILEENAAFADTKAIYEWAYEQLGKLGKLKP